MTKIKKTIAVLLILLMTISGMPHMAFADEVTESVVTTEESEAIQEMEEVISEEPPATEDETEESEEVLVEDDVSIIEDETVEDSSDGTQEDDLSSAENEESVSPVEPEDQGGEDSESDREEEIVSEIETDEDESDASDDRSEDQTEAAEDEAEDTEEAEDTSEDEPEETADDEPTACKMTIVLQDVRDDVAIERNGETIAKIVGNPAPGSGSFFIVGQTMLEEMAKNGDGTTSFALDAMTGDVVTIRTIQPSYAVIHYYAEGELQPAKEGTCSIVSITMDSDTVITIDGDYSAAEGFYAIPGTRGLLKAATRQTLPDAIYVSLGSAYDTYSSTATVNGHRGVYFFQPEGVPEGLYVSATCGSTTKTMVSGTHYKVARISEYAARAYLDYGTGCCSQRAQRALAWITHHGQSEYDWNRANKNQFVMGDGQLSVANQLEAYTITFLAAWVCTNDGRVGSYGTVHVEDGAHALDFMFGSSFSTGLPATTKSGIDKMVAWGLAFADAHPDGDENVPEYCNKHPEASIGDYGYSGFRVDTEKYSYLLRVTPQKGEYNLYCYCYLKDRLDHHINEARRGIRFIDTNYRDKFVLTDGEKIRITYRDGEHDDRTCRYMERKKEDYIR